MHALRRLPRGQCAPWLARGNATVQAATAPTPLPPPAQSAKPKAKAAAPTATTTEAGTGTATADVKAEEATKTRFRRFPTSRPSITLERPRQYMRPVGLGVLPVYDLAVSYIKKDSENLKAELAGFKLQLESGKLTPEEAEKVKEKVEILEVQSEINLPSVRWKARNGLGMYSVEFLYCSLLNGT